MLAGLDLAGNEKNDTGICLLNNEIELYTVKTDEEILDKLGRVHLVAIDAPLIQTNKPFRNAEKELMKKYGPILPLNTPGMKKLTNRALILIKKLNCDIIETYPRAVEKSLDIKEENTDIKFQNDHEYDAYLCALSARFYRKEEYESYGTNDEVIIIPKKN